MGGVRTYAIVFLPSHEALMKRLLTEAHGNEGEFTSKMAKLKEEIMDLECKVQDLVAKLHDMKSSP
jgi:phage host-nuclease inhibitor protein Gam